MNSSRPHPLQRNMDVESCPHLSSLSLCLPPSLFLSLSLPPRHSFPLSSLSYAVSPPSVSPGAHSGSSCLLTNYRSWHQDLLPGLCRGASYMQVRCISLNLWISVGFNLSKLFTFCLFLRLCHCWSFHSLRFFLHHAHQPVAKTGSALCHPPFFYEF